MYESRSRTRREQLLADQRCPSASTATSSSAGEDARKRHLLGVRAMLLMEPSPALGQTH
jgi:hypothetical protein